MRVTSSQLLVFGLLYTSYALCLILKRNYAFWKDDVVSEGLAKDARAMGSFGGLWESANGVSKVAGSVLVDFLSPTLVLSASLAAQGGSSVLLAWAFGRVPLAAACLLWGVNGFMQAFAWPALALIFLAWFPRPEERGLWYGVLATCQNAGAAIGPFVTQAAAERFGWRARLWLPGALVLLFPILLVATLHCVAPRVEPQEAAQPLLASREAAASPSSRSGSKARQRRAPSPAAGAAAAARLRGGGTLQAPKVAAAPPPPQRTLSSLLLDVLSSRDQWLLAANYFFNSAVRNTVTTFVKTLLVEDMGHSLDMANTGNFAFEVGGALGGLVSGALSDWCFQGRRGPIMFLFSVALVPLPVFLPYLRGASAGSVGVVYLLLGLAAFPSHVLNGLMSRELAPPAMQSTAGGWTKCWGQLGASLADYFVPLLVASWGWGGVTQAMTLAAALAALSVLPLWWAVALPQKAKRA